MHHYVWYKLHKLANYTLIGKYLSLFHWSSSCYHYFIYFFLDGKENVSEFPVKDI